MTILRILGEGVVVAIGTGFLSMGAFLAGTAILPYIPKNIASAFVGSVVMDPRNVVP